MWQMIGTQLEAFLKGIWVPLQWSVRTPLEYDAAQHPLTEMLSSPEKTAISF